LLLSHPSASKHRLFNEKKVSLLEAAIIAVLADGDRGEPTTATNKFLYRDLSNELMSNEDFCSDPCNEPMNQLLLGGGGGDKLISLVSTFVQISLGRMTNIENIQKKYMR
jgi:hypothetical protein